MGTTCKPEARKKKKGYYLSVATIAGIEHAAIDRNLRTCRLVEDILNGYLASKAVPCSTATEHS